MNTLRDYIHSLLTRECAVLPPADFTLWVDDSADTLQATLYVRATSHALLPREMEVYRRRGVVALTKALGYELSGYTLAPEATIDYNERLTTIRWMLTKE